MERAMLTREEADKMLVPGEHVHTFAQCRTAAGPLLGCDVSREKILGAEILELSGEQAMAVNHGVAAFLDGRWLFVATVEQEEP
jgi:hypothetical protein